MSRLTTSQNYCDDCDFGREKECFFDDKEKFNCKDKQIYEKLREYEDLEEQGLLLKLPCKIGDKVYIIIDDTIPQPHFYIEEYEVQDLSVYEIKFADDWIRYSEQDMFFSREQAEQKIKEMEREDK